MAPRAMTEKAEAYLEIRDGAGNVTHNAVDGSHISIGRSSRAQIRLQHNKVSRFHAEMFRDPFGRWWVRDLGSRNGIRVNGKRYLEKLLKPGDTIRIYDYQLTFYLTPPPVDPSLHVGTLHIPMAPEDHVPDEIRTIPDLESSKIDAQHLYKMIDFGNRLLELDEAPKRLQVLCRLMVRRDFRGRIAAVLRLRKDRPDDPPQMLCEEESRYHEREQFPYVSRHLLQHVRKTEAPALASNVNPGSDVLGISLAAEVSPMSAVACPLRSTAKILDVLYVVLPPEYGTSEWLALTAMAARQFQQVESAWVARRQAQQQAVIAGEIERASELQMSLIPRDAQVEELEVAVGFEPCRWVGGDYVDVVRVGQGRIFLTVADVSGKGLQAALITASLHTMVHASLRAGLSLEHLFDHMNRYLCDSLPEQSFVTMAAVMVDTRTGRIECVNTGHPPVIVVQPDGSVRQLESALNLPLGIDPEMKIEIQQGQIEPGELVVLYSDGVTEMADETGRLLGINRLADQLASLYRQSCQGSLRECADALTKQLNRLLGRHVSADDRTFLLARRTAPEPAEEAQQVDPAEQEVSASPQAHS